MKTFLQLILTLLTILPATVSSSAEQLSAAASSRPFIEPITGMEFVKISAGCFMQGNDAGDADEKPAHRTCLNDYYIGKFEVTQEQWRLAMGARPSYFNTCGDNCPVESVSWDDAQEFIGKLNRMNGGTFRLPTEAEWEYACRSGGKVERFCGSDHIDIVGWIDRNSGSRPHPVGTKQPNGLGIHDMTGNVWEWVSDRFQKEYYGVAPTHNPAGPATGLKRVIRGGSWYNDERNVRASNRWSDAPNHRSINLGLRLVYTEH